MIKELIQKEKFNPSIIGFFINNNFLLRKGLYSGIKLYSNELKGIMLDFGCGTKPYKNLFKKVDKYIGVDFKIEGRNQKLDEDDKFYDGKTIPFNNDFFDSILATEVLEHVFNLDEILNEMNRVLKKGGVALITTPFMWEEHEMPYDFARYTSAALNSIYERHNFEVIHKKKLGNNTLVVFQFILNFLKNLLPFNKQFNFILIVPFVAIINLIALVFNLILPKKKEMYFNNLYLLRKK